MTLCNGAMMNQSESPSFSNETTGAELLERLGTVLKYPDATTQPHLQHCIESLCDQQREAAELLERLNQYMLETPLWSVQELYTTTFDLSPVCSMDVGYHLFGEDYQRGVFMAQLLESMEEAGMVAQKELPDHLPVVLQWMSRVYATELHTDMAIECVLPTMRKMDESFVDSTNPYRGALRAVAILLKSDLTNRGIPVPDVALVERSPFLGYSGCDASAIPGMACPSHSSEKLLTLTP